MPIRIEHLSYIYGEGTSFEKKALDDISLEIGDGEFIGLIGHTGSGKSTLIQHLNGLNKASSGRILVDGEDIRSEGYSLKKLRGKVGLDSAAKSAWSFSIRNISSLRRKY